MITTYKLANGALAVRSPSESWSNVLWVDVLNPTKEDDAEVERMTGVDIPTREEMAEIEVSSRLYQEKGSHFMTANLLYAVDSPAPIGTNVTFILADKLLVTVRYAEPRAFGIFVNRANKGDITCASPVDILLGLLEIFIDREADLIERLQADTEKIAQSIFESRTSSKARTFHHEVTLKQIGRVGETTARVRESLLSLDRVITYLGQVTAAMPGADQIRHRLRTEGRDVQSLTDHVQYLNQRITFMLEATLGMVTIEQNQIIKLFSVAAVMLMPPTLIASIYGMNFKNFPELSWEYGYPMSLAMMVGSALLFFVYFRRRGWL